ncbi:hypothetical protein ANOM_010255 [Aspergillus nomiae NRRL 13137]|uniref:Methyltransferase domain-containing protein n=1 Tax=Aspergillus nomiae NRRL (strain ATCC 15546 / NRRL 13137 / CBS 260.88 / M93) TaxID=1509407 RepID=A0A0L1IRB3_ASPN3|nr:uncharacterized protein ANOM_010255 [Aspergillus nomiae NRRL 13137]KNG82022.1 hypothetical protein ANOM_010255 [Aspergillus nomiae NRRL 13137]
MASSPEYVFSRDYLDNNRINLQHYLVVQLFGYRIHPSIPTQSPDLRIADVGTGTGIWLTDLAGELPKSARLDALDISFAAAPLPEMLPPNVSLHQWDVKTDVPEHLMGVYDVVHLRFFAFVIQEHELDMILERLLKLLKPGGYIQWTDIDISSLRLEKIRPDIQADAQVKLMNQFKGNDNRLDSAWVPTLAKRLANKGLIDIVTDAREAPPHLALALHEVGLLATEVLTRNKASSGTEEVARAMKQTLAQAAKETRDGSYLAFTRYTVVARKKDPA